MSALDFIGRHWESGLQVAVTAWFASIARNFQITLAVHGTRLEAHREAVRRSLVLWWLQKEDQDQQNIRQGMLDWIAINDVFLSPAAAEAFKIVERYKTLQFSLEGRAGLAAFNEAEAALATLKRELLRFRKLTLREAMVERWRLFRGRKRR